MEFVVPSDQRNLRACLQCRLIKTVDQFAKNGCENCQWSTEYQDRTSINFTGVVAVINPGDSWVTKRLNLNHVAVCGTYAIDVPKVQTEDE